MDVEDDKAYTKLFISDRDSILMDIEQLLNQVLRFLKYFRVTEAPENVTKNFCQVNLRLLFKSVCFIHGFYLYPVRVKKVSQAAINGGETESSMAGIIVDKVAVIKIVKCKFGNHYPTVLESDFWREIYNYTTVDNLPREPAHLFLQLAREVLPRSPGVALKIVKKYLEKLPYKNSLKPVVWAEYPEDLSICGVSVGARHHVRPIFLCVKLLRSNENTNRVSLSATVALQMAQETKEYKDKIPPCPSCAVIFSDVHSNKTARSCAPLGNCAEYDIIHNVKLNFILDNFVTEWATFQSACGFVFDKFRKLICNTNVKNNADEYIAMMKEKNMILQYIKTGENNYELDVINWWEFKKLNLRKQRMT